MKIPNKHIFFNGLPDFEQQEIEEKIKSRTPAAPSFSLEDMETARQESFNKGHADGLQTAKNSIEQQTEILVQSIINDVSSFETQELKRQKRYINDAISIAYKATEKILTALLDDQKEILIKSALTDFMQDHTPKTTLSLYVHPTLEKSVQKYIKILSPTIDLKSDDTLGETQSRMEWIDGTFEFAPDKMVQSILDAIHGKMNDDQAIVDETQKIDHNKDETQISAPESEEK
jgi:flagellar biosynthesis/type III secretory pathway protein FliH